MSPTGAPPPPPPPPPPDHDAVTASTRAGRDRGGLWSRFRARSRRFQVISWVLVGVLVLSVIGALLPPEDAEPTVATRATTTTTSRPTTTTATTTTRPRTTTTRPTTTTARPTTTSPPATTTTPPSGDAASRAALAQLAQLPVKGRAPKTGYDRDQFGQAWSDDVDVTYGHNGCDTRNDMLREDLQRIVLKPGTNDCVVLSGVLPDPYTSRIIPFVRGPESADVQIDHVVALSDAWQKGAQQLSVDERQNFANDPRNLQATDGPTNQQKSDGDAATWLPPNRSHRCTYVARQVDVKSVYRLWVTVAERDAIARVLSSCVTGSTPPPTTAAPRPFVAPAPAPTPPPVAPPPAAPPPQILPVVHPGAFCAPAGATGVTNKGTPMVCRTSPTDSRNRWRSAG